METPAPSRRMQSDRMSDLECADLSALLVVTTCRDHHLSSALSKLRPTKAGTSRRTAKGGRGFSKLVSFGLPIANYYPKAVWA